MSERPPRTVRGAAAVGAGLAPARPARALEANERIHVVGVAGAGASAAALLAARAGAVVSGCDSGGPSTYTPPLEAAGIPLAWSHDPGHVTGTPGPRRLAVTKALTAVAPDHPELAAARALGIPVEPWQQVVADVAVGRRLIGVAGTHGKSTVTGWLVDVLVRAGRDPSAFVGALLPETLTGDRPGTARWGSGPDFVVEADEYAGNFDAYRPAVAVVTSVEWDHPDVFADLGAVVDAFAGWLRQAAVGPVAGEGSGISRAPVLVANGADPGVVETLRRLGGWPGGLVVTALLESEPLDPDAARRELTTRLGRSAGPTRTVLGWIEAADPGGTLLAISGHGEPSAPPVRTRLRLAGRHNAANALAVAGTGVALGVPTETILSSLAGFAGVGRRLERRGEAAGVVVYDDYGHHPTAIRETLRSPPPARARASGVGGLRAAHLPPDGRAPRRLRRCAGGRRRGGRRRHLGGPRPRHHDRLRRGPGRGSSGAPL